MKNENHNDYINKGFIKRIWVNYTQGTPSVSPATPTPSPLNNFSASIYVTELIYLIYFYPSEKQKNTPQTIVLRHKHQQTLFKTQIRTKVS